MYRRRSRAIGVVVACDGSLLGSRRQLRDATVRWSTGAAPQLGKANMANTDVLADAARQRDDIEPTPVHRAIDSLAAVGIEVQLLRRKRQRGETIESAELDEAISRIEPQLDGLAVILASLRDQSPL